MRERRKASGSNVGAERRGWSWESGWRDGRSREPAGEEGEDGGEGSGGLWGDDGSSIREVVDFGMAGDDEWMREIKTTQPASLLSRPILSLHFVLISAALRLATTSHQDENILPLQELHGSKTRIIFNPS